MCMLNQRGTKNNEYLANYFQKGYLDQTYFIPIMV